MIKLSEYEKSLLFELIEKTTGCHQSGIEKKQLFVSNVESLMRSKGITDFADLLFKIEKSEKLYQTFISTVTIHTTFWFREPEHFDKLEKLVTSFIQKGQTQFSFWSSACSTGQEVYTAGLVFEKIRKTNPQINYKLYGSDIDSESVNKAQKAIFSTAELANIPNEYKKFLLLGTEKLTGYFTLTPEIRKRCEFLSLNLRDDTYKNIPLDLDFAFCRNVLIYFHQSLTGIISRKIASHLKTGGHLFLGHSEPINKKLFGLNSLGSCVYEKKIEMASIGIGANQQRPLALIIDDVAMFRVILSKALSKIGFDCLEAESAEQATQILKQKPIDFITLDLRLPGQNGAAWLRDQRIAGYQCPVIVISGSSPEEAEEVYGALSVGAQDFIEKSKLTKNLDQLTSIAKVLVQKNRPELFSSLKEADISFIPPEPKPELMKRIQAPRVFVIGASTGGPEALWYMLRTFPKPCPPIVIVQHTSPFFSSQFSQTVSQSSGLELGTIEQDVALQPNTVYLAQGDYHLELNVNKQNHLILQTSQNSSVHGHRPSVDVLFRSLAKLPIPSISVLLTGMGSDGAKGLLDLYSSGWSYTLAQSEDSCVVYSMPKEAIKLGAVHQVGDLDWIRQRLIEFSKDKKKTAA